MPDVISRNKYEGYRRAVNVGARHVTTVQRFNGFVRYNAITCGSARLSAGQWRHQLRDTAARKLVRVFLRQVSNRPQCAVDHQLLLEMFSVVA